MLVSFNINSVPVSMAKFFSAADAAEVFEGTAAARRVVFIDTPATPTMVGVIETLIGRGVVVVVRDHHDVVAPRNPREAEIAAAAARVRELVGAGALISDRTTHPSCAALVEVGEFAGEGTILVVDPDLDGLTAAMKAAGVWYDGLDQDADVLDGPRAMQTAERLTPFALLLTRAMAGLPPYDAARPQASVMAKAELFSSFVAVVQGDLEARARLERGVEAYEAGVAEAHRLLGTVTEPVAGVFFVDVTSPTKFDLATLAAGMEGRPGCKVTVQRKAFGPVAAKCGGIQYSLAVPRPLQAAVNLQEFLAPGFVSAPEAGVISNTPFLLHCSEGVWQGVILPALQARFGG